MAGRTSSSIGVGITVTALGLLSLTLFVLTIIFYSQKNAAEKNLADRDLGDAKFITQAERASDAVLRVRGAADQQHQSVVGYLLDTRQQIMQSVTGSGSDTPEQVKAKLTTALGKETSQDMLAVIRGLKTQFDGAEQARKDAQAARDRALEDRNNEVERVAKIQATLGETIAALTQQVEQYKSEVDIYRGQVTESGGKMTGEVEKIRQQFDDQIARLNADKTKLEQESRVNLDRINRLQSELRGTQFTGKSEDALVDAEVLGINPLDGTVVVGAGRKQKVVLGLNFEIYADAATIRPNEEGEYPQGKASVEIIRVDENSSVGRLIRQTRGNPVVKGDVLANAVYDPRKTYKFMVFGNFDTNGDGTATPEEQNDLRARVESWGGKVLDDLSGDVDFLVLGEKPILPPEPPSNAPMGVIERYLAIRQQVTRYDELFAQATAANIPVLNQHRLATLTGTR